MAKKIRTRRFEAAVYLADEASRVAYFEEALADGDAAVIAAALGDLARARGMSEVARASGLGRESLYKALSPSGNPELATVLRILRVLDLELHAAARGERAKLERSSPTPRRSARARS